MTTYAVNLTDSTKAPLQIPEETIDTSTDLALFGRKQLQYGADMNQNMLSLLEKFACPENPFIPGVPNLTRSNGKLANPITGQLWYNSTQKIPFVWNGTKWISLLSGGSIASNWGIIFDGQQLPQPVGEDGYIFPYSECVWIVSPFTIDGEILDYNIETTTNGIVTAQFNSGQSLVVNYLIVGIRGNVNNGVLNPVCGNPTPTPTISVTPSHTPQAINLHAGLVSFWEFEEAGTDSFFLDGVGTNNFTRTGSIATSLPSPPPSNGSHGKVGHAIQAGTTSFFESNPTLGMAAGNNASYTFGGWYKLNSNFTAYSNLFQRGIFGASGQRSFSLTYTLSSDSLALYKSNDGTAYEFIITPLNIGLKDFNWHFIVAWVDTATLTLNIQIDNGVIYSEPFMFPITFDIGTLKLGSSTGIPLQSAVDQLFYYSRTLNAVERAALWNNGNGITAASAAGLITPTPTPTISPSPTPPVTPTINALTVALNTHFAQGGSNTNTNSIFGSVTGGVFPYTFQWVYVAGAVATINSPSSAQTSFTRSSASIGYYRLKTTDAANVVVYSAIVEVQTT